MKPVIKALFLSAVVLPGLGQLYLGRRVRGATLIAVTTLMAIPALFVVMKIISAIVAFRVGADPNDMSQLQNSLAAYAWPAKLVIGGFLSIWVFSVIDVIMIARQAETDPAD